MRLCTVAVSRVSWVSTHRMLSTRVSHAANHQRYALSAAAVAAGAAAAMLGYQAECRKLELELDDATANELLSVLSAGALQAHHPSAMRNRIPILKAMLALVPEDTSGPALEIASGTGAHLEVLAPAFPNLTFHPSEYVPEIAAAPGQQWSTYGKIGLRQSLDELQNIDAHGSAIFKNVAPAVALDLTTPYADWPASVRANEGKFKLVVVCNTLHITPWACSVGLLEAASRLLAPGGQLLCYGPFKVGGQFVGSDGGAGNARFDQRLRDTNGSWGIRDIEELSQVAAPLGLSLKSVSDMPANNFTLAFIKGTLQRGSSVILNLQS